MINFYEAIIGVSLVIVLPILVELLSVLAKLTNNSPNLNIIKLANASQLQTLMKNLKSREIISLEGFIFYSIITSLNIYAFSLLYRVFTSEMTPIKISSFFSFYAIYAFVSLILAGVIDLYSSRRINISSFIDKLTFSLSVLMLAFIGFGLKLTQTEFTILDACFVLLFQVVLYLSFFKYFFKNEKQSSFNLRVASALRMGLNMCTLTLYLISSGIYLKPEHFALTIFCIILIELFMNIFAFDALKLQKQFRKLKLERLCLVTLSIVLTLKVLL